MIVADRLDVGLGLELRQQHDGGMRGAGELGQRQRIHVVERGCDQIAMALEIGRKPRLDHPDVALVRQHDALRHAGRARGVEEHRGLARLRDHGLELARIDETVEAGAALLAEDDGRHILRRILEARAVAEHELGAGVLDDEMDGLLRKPVVHRHGDEARAHDAEIGGDEFGAVGRQDGDAVAARKAALGERARHALGHGVERGVGVFGRRVLAAEVDDRELGDVALAIDQVAEIFELSHQGSSEPRNAASAIMSSCVRLATAGFIRSTGEPLRLPVLMSLSWRKM